MKPVRIFNFFEATGHILYEQQFSNFHSSSVNKGISSQSVFKFFTAFYLTIFSAKLFSGSTSKKQPVSFIFQISAGSSSLVYSRSISIQAITVYAEASPASQFTILSLTPYERFHFSKHLLQAGKFSNSS